VKRVFLSPPWIGAEERAAAEAAFDSGYVAPCGPMVDEFERGLAALSGRKYAVAVSSGTAAIDLVTAHLGVDSSWTVVAPTLTFMATVGPAWHRGARLVFVDSDATGNVDLALLERALSEERRRSPRRKFLFAGVDLYGRCCDYAEVSRICRRYGAEFLCDSAEAVGATCGGRPSGSVGLAGVYSFNGNKIITTSGGGAVVTDSKKLADHVRSMSQQSREPKPWYEHREVGYNYRLSNVLAAIGLAQLRKLPEILERRRRNAELYARLFAGTEAEMLPPREGENHWLSVALLGSERRRDALLKAFASAGLEARPVWKPMHLQPVFAKCMAYGGAVAEDLFRRGVCLPSGSGLCAGDWRRIRAAAEGVLGGKARTATRLSNKRKEPTDGTTP